MTNTCQTATSPVTSRHASRASNTVLQRQVANRIVRLLNRSAITSSNKIGDNSWNRSSRAKHSQLERRTRQFEDQPTLSENHEIGRGD